MSPGHTIETLKGTYWCARLSIRGNGEAALVVGAGDRWPLVGRRHDVAAG
jgi:hypothetical protein